jgi:hypothetical protein
MRAGTVGGMPTLCRFLRIFYRVVVEMAKQHTFTGFHSYFGYAFYQTPSPTGIKWEDISEILDSTRQPFIDKRRKILTPAQRGTVRRMLCKLKGAKQATPRAKTAFFKPGTLPPAVYAATRRQQADSPSGFSEVSYLEEDSFVAVNVSAFEDPAMTSHLAAVAPYAVCRLLQPVGLLDREARP